MSICCFDPTRLLKHCVYVTVPITSVTMRLRVGVSWSMIVIVAARWSVLGCMVISRGPCSTAGVDRTVMNVFLMMCGSAGVTRTYKPWTADAAEPVPKRPPRASPLPPVT